MIDVRRIGIPWGKPWAAFWPAETALRKLRIVLICREKRRVTTSTCTGPDTKEQVRSGARGMRRRRKCARMQPLWQHR
jgi:hypothetical protein